MELSALAQEASELETKAVFYARSVITLAKNGNLDLIIKYHEIGVSLDFDDGAALKAAILNDFYNIAHFILQHVDYNKGWRWAITALSEKSQKSEFDDTARDFARYLFKNQPKSQILVTHGLEFCKRKLFEDEANNSSYVYYRIEWNKDYYAGLRTFVENCHSPLMEKLCLELLTQNIPTTKKAKESHLKDIIRCLTSTGKLQILANFLEIVPVETLPVPSRNRCIDPETDGDFEIKFGPSDHRLIERLSKLFDHIKWYFSIKYVLENDYLDTFVILATYPNVREQMCKYEWSLSQFMSKKALELWGKLKFPMASLNTMVLCEMHGFDCVREIMTKFDSYGEQQFLYYAAIVMGKLDVVPENFSPKGIKSAFLLKLVKSPNVESVPYLESRGITFDFKKDCYLSRISHEDVHPLMQKYFSQNKTFAKVSQKRHSDIYALFCPQDYHAYHQKNQVESKKEVLHEIELGEIDPNPQQVLESYVELLKKKALKKKIEKAKKKIHNCSYLDIYIFEYIYEDNKTIALEVISSMPYEFVCEHLDEIGKLAKDDDLYDTILKMLNRFDIKNATEHILRGIIKNGDVHFLKRVLRQKFNGIFPQELATDLYWLGVKLVKPFMVKLAFRSGFVKPDNFDEILRDESLNLNLSHVPVSTLKKLMRVAKIPNRPAFLSQICRSATLNGNGEILEYISEQIDIDLPSQFYFSDETLFYNFAAVNLMLKHRIQISTKYIDVRDLDALGNVPFAHAKVLLEVMEYSNACVEQYANILAQKYIQNDFVEGIVYLESCGFDFDEFFTTSYTVYTGGFPDENFTVGSEKMFYILCGNLNGRIYKLFDYFVNALSESTLNTLINHADPSVVALLTHLRVQTHRDHKYLLKHNIITPDTTNPEMVLAYAEAIKNPWRIAAKYHPGHIDSNPVLSQAQEHFNAALKVQMQMQIQS
jgi:hypothetical protein